MSLDAIQIAGWDIQKFCLIFWKKGSWYFRILCFVVLFITYFKLDTLCTYSCIGTSGKNCQNPHERVLVKTTAENLWCLFQRQSQVLRTDVPTYGAFSRCAQVSSYLSLPLFVLVLISKLMIFDLSLKKILSCFGFCLFPSYKSLPKR